MTHIIEASRIYWPAFVEPVATAIPTDNPRYGCSVLLSDVPFELVNHVTPKALSARAISTNLNNPELADNKVCQLYQPFKPRLTTTNGFDGLRALAKLYELAKTANIKPDRLFHAVPGLLAVEPVEWIEPAVIGQCKTPQPMKALQIVAVQVGIGELRDNFERLLTEYFP